MQSYSSSRLPNGFSIILSTMVLISGAVTMSLEFATSRLLIPIFGSSIYTWGSLIGVILAGLTIGYQIGGRLADKKPSLSKFCLIIFSSGLYIVFIPFISPVISSSIHSSVLVTTHTDITDSNANNAKINDNNNANGAQYASLIATFLLLITPSLLLGIISPYAIRLGTNTLSRLGNTVGNLYSAATTGSILGTFLTVFVLIPAFEINYIIFGLGLTLIILASVIGLGKLPKILAGFLVLVLYLPNSFLVVNPVPYYIGHLVYQKETPYSHLDVVDSLDSTQRALYLDGNLHSIMSKQNPSELMTYTRYFPVAFLFNPHANHVLFLGGGGFSGPKYFLKTYPGITVDVVEIDPVVIEVAKKYFNLTDNARLKIYNDDARDFLSKTNTNQKYDIIILDAFSKNYIPFHLMTLQYYELLYNKLTPNGLIVSNQVGSLDGDRSNLYRAAYKTISHVFPNVYVFPTKDFSADSVQNIILLATIASANNDTIVTNAVNIQDDIKHKEQQQKEQEEQTILQKIILAGTNKNIRRSIISNTTTTIGTSNSGTSIDYADHLYDSTRIRTESVPLLTDQFAPVENILNPVTNQPYNIDQKQIATNTKVDLLSAESIMVRIIFPMLIAAIWIYCLLIIWNRRGMKQRMV